MDSMFNKIAAGLKNGVSSVLDFTESKVLGFLHRRYPDLNDVMEILSTVKHRVQDDDVPDLAGASSPDDKWRPVLLTIALLCKLQKLNDHMEDSGWYNSPQVIMDNPDEEEKMLDVFGCYWHTCVRIAKGLRSFDPNADKDTEVTPNETEALINHLSETSGICPVDILVAHSTDSRHLEGGHCPDFAVVLIHEHKQILVNICGTRMIPQPKMMDVFMDLAADATPFLNGRAHRGMAVGSNNILDKCKDQLIQAVQDHPDYGVLVTGYSLGAGICQLLTMELMNDEHFSETTLRCISYGAPPVFEGDSGDVHFPNLFSVVNNNDGLASASLDTVTKFFEQIKAVEGMQLGRRQMLKMLMEKIPTRSGQDIHEEDDDDDEDVESVVDELVDHWRRLKMAVESVEKENSLGVAKLDHPSAKLYNFKKKSDDKIVTRVFQDTRPLTKNLRLKPSMFNHHMPWGYNSIFADRGTSVDQVPIELFEEVLKA